MKDRILAYLDAFANERPNDLAAELKTELNLDDQTFLQRAQETQAAILHDYSQFSISTIDAFFQKVIRAFTREAGLVGDYRLEVEHDTVLREVIDDLIDELGNDKELTDWVVEFAKENLENERAWDVRFSLIEFAKEIFREEFKAIEENVNRVTAEKQFFRNLKEQLWKVKTHFLRGVSTPAQKALHIIDANGWRADDFSFGRNSGLFTFFKLFAYERNVSRMESPGKRIRGHFTDPEKWPAKNSPHKNAIQRAAADQLVPILKTIVDIYDAGFKKALSAEVALKNLYVFGLISDISRKLKEYKDENNLMLLADAPKFLNGVIRDSDTPFIYEKVGSFYKNYLIDEFQDTSGMQWKNFQPLIVNSLDQGYHSLVVGDVKQAIYRWRGGDLGLLQDGVIPVIGPERTAIRELDSNYRSSSAVVKFNNQLFLTASKNVAAATGSPSALAAYTDVAQRISKTTAGFVHVQFIRDEKTEPEKEPVGREAGPKSWKELALEMIPAWLERLQEHRVALKDIAILVRKNDEGQQIATYLLDYKNSDRARPGCRYDVVSNESLRIDGASAVNLLLGAMQYLLNPDDAIARAQLGFEYARIHEPDRVLSEVFTVANQAIYESNLPAAFTREKVALRKLSLIELTETLIRIFRLGSIKGELVYIQAFQDIILEFCNRERNDLGAFLEWWKDNRHKRSVTISGQVEAVQILTIHKSKGLQFPYVIVPFCAWSLDHENWQAPNLWVNSDLPPFKDAGYLPVKYSKSLADTFFDSFYQEEKSKTYLDNLNLLYVATTRAIHGMIITAPAPDVKGARDSVAGLLHQSVTQNEHLGGSWDESLLRWSSGDWQIAPSTTADLREGIELEEYKVSPWQDKLVIRQQAVEYFDADTSDRRKKVNYGVQMHAVLSRLRVAGEISKVLQEVIGDGLIESGEGELIHKELSDLLSIAQVASWFSTGWNVRTEIPIIKPGGQQSRIDRLLLNEASAIVIDFKTGTPDRSDHQQVSGYMELLRKMNYTDVKGYLLYLRDKAVVEVKMEGKPRLLKKTPSKDQLTLGF